MKKLLIGLTALTLLTFAGSASAICFGSGCGFSFGSDQTVSFNSGTVNNNVVTVAKTGGNEIENEGAKSDDNKIWTGDAFAGSFVYSTLNSNLNEDCCGFFGTDQSVKFNSGTVNNNVVTVAKTGGNEIENEWGKSDDNTIWTGYAGAQTEVYNTVNSNDNEGCCGFGTDQTVNFNHALVNNDIVTVAKTGGNEIENEGCWFFGGSDDNKIWTGIAESYSGVFTTVNSNIMRNGIEE